MKKIAVICKKGYANHKGFLSVIEYLAKSGNYIAVAEENDLKYQNLLVMSEEEMVAEADLVVVLGGDGTLIHAAHLLDGRSIPVLGVNLGTLGFLTEIPLNNVEEAVDLVLQDKYKVSSRKMLNVDLVRNNSSVLHGKVLNDAVINKGALARILRLDAHTEDGIMTSYRGDGLIISTPTGSTAYNMAAGGPVIFPTLSALILTPICPHTFANRPVVLPDHQKVTIELTEANGQVFLTLDGQEGVEMVRNDKIIVEVSPNTINLIRSPKLDFFNILRQKLGWGK